MATCHRARYNKVWVDRHRGRLNVSNTLSIASFELKHGFGSYERCQIAERRVRIANRNLGNAGRITPRSLERQGLPTSLAVDYCELLYGPIKAHKLHLASDRTSCTKATANQFRLLIHTAAYWLLHSLRGLAPKTSFWRNAQFDIIRCNLIKVAGRIQETATRIKVALPSNFLYPGSLRLLSGRVVKLPP